MRTGARPCRPGLYKETCRWTSAGHRIREGPPATPRQRVRVQVRTRRSVARHVATRAGFPAQSRARPHAEQTSVTPALLSAGRISLCAPAGLCAAGQHRAVAQETGDDACCSVDAGHGLRGRSVECAAISELAEGVPAPASHVAAGAHAPMRPAPAPIWLGRGNAEDRYRRRLAGAAAVSGCERKLPPQQPCGATGQRDARERHPDRKVGSRTDSHDIHRLRAAVRSAVAELPVFVVTPALDGSVRSRAHAEVLLTLTWVAVLIPSTVTGVVWLGAGVPSPSCPLQFAPQHFTVPPVITAQLLPLPTLTCVALLTPLTVTGVLLLLVVPSPSSP